MSEETALREPGGEDGRSAGASEAQAASASTGLRGTPGSRSAVVSDGPDRRADEAVIAATLECEHTLCSHDDEADRLWEYVEHKGQTWNRCRSCGLLELWQGGMRVAVELPALASLSLRLQNAETALREIREVAMLRRGDMPSLRYTGARRCGCSMSCGDDGDDGDVRIEREWFQYKPVSAWFKTLPPGPLTAKHALEIV